MSRRVVAPALLLAAGAMLGLSCSGTPRHPPQREEAPAPARSLEEVIAAHADSLMAIPGVVGVGQGDCAGTPCIKILVVQQTEALKRLIPTALEGHPVEVVATGEFRASD